MSNEHDPYDICYLDVSKIVDAMEIVYLKQLMKVVEGFIGTLPIDDPRPPPRDQIPIKLIRTEINRIHEIETLRFKYVRRVHIDPEGAKAIAGLCREAAKIIEADMKDK